MGISSPRNERPEKPAILAARLRKSGSFAKACMDEGIARKSGHEIRLDDGRDGVPVYMERGGFAESDEEPATPRIVRQDEIPTLVNNPVPEPPIRAQGRQWEGFPETEAPTMKSSPPDDEEFARGRISSYPPQGKGGDEIIRSLRYALTGCQAVSLSDFSLARFLADICGIEVQKELDGKKQNGLLRVRCRTGKSYRLFINPTGTMPGTSIDGMVMLTRGSTMLCLFEDKTEKRE